MYLLEMTANMQAYYRNSQGYSVELKKGEDTFKQKSKDCALLKC